MTGPALMPQTFPTSSTASTVRTSLSSRGIGGTGLGLAITRAIVGAHGGSVTVTSDGLGQGVTVTIRLPLLQVPLQCGSDR